MLILLVDEVLILDSPLGSRRSWVVSKVGGEESSVPLPVRLSGAEKLDDGTVAVGATVATFLHVLAPGHYCDVRGHGVAYVSEVGLVAVAAGGRAGLM